MHDTVTKMLSQDDATLRVQVLNIDRWLIPRMHDDIPRFTTRNQVDPLIDGQATFAAMHAAFTAATQEGDYIYITAWDLVPTINLLGRRRGGEVQAVLALAASRGVDVRLLVWFVTRAFGIPGTNIFMDNKTRGPGSHHQKTAIVKAGDTLTSFVGGIDMTRDRWDTPAHRFPDPDADYKGSGQPWHDVHARVRGPAAADIETNFRQRWNDRGMPTVGSPALPAPPVPTHPTPPAVPGGTHIVQTLRTFPHHATRLNFNWHFDFAPTGEIGLRLAYHRAIANARDYIYIEDQYVISDGELSPAIAAAMRRSPTLQVIIVTAAAPDTPPRDAFDFHQNAFMNRLRAIDPARAEIFHLVNATGTDIYCHSKVCIVDDIWAIIGSCNISTRSLTHDSEISIAVLDETIEHGRRRYARQLRIALWSEHLGLTPAEQPLIDDPIAGAALWRTRAGTSPAHAMIHRRPAGSDSIAWNTLVDPDGTLP